jgi:hypothetical protein
MWMSYVGQSRTAPSSQPKYHGGVDVAPAFAGLAGPYSQMGFTWNRPAVRARTAAVNAQTATAGMATPDGHPSATGWRERMGLEDRER